MYFIVRLFKNDEQISSYRLYGSGNYHNLMLKDEVVEVEEGDILRYRVQVSSTTYYINELNVIIRELK